MKNKITSIVLVCFLLQSCTGQEEKILKVNTILFFDPLYYFSHDQGACIEKRKVIECDWSTQKANPPKISDKEVN
ncbi:hypothetical protein JE380_004182 [Salmonella enterica]|nr:hypothetical protein [Salmonella enterica]